MSPRKAPPARPNQPFDEDRLRSIFARVEPPERLANGWQHTVAVIAEDAPARGRQAAGGKRPGRSLAHGFAAAVAALALGGGIVAVVSADRAQPPEPEPAITDTITQAPTSNTSQPSVPSDAPVSPSEPAVPPGGPPATGTQPPGVSPPRATPPPAATPDPGPLTGWPNSGNVGVPAGTRLDSRAGDLHVTTAGAVISDLRVDGVIFIDAPDVTLRRVLVAPPSGATAAIVQRAPRLTIEHSEITGAADGLAQQAAGLTLRRVDVHTNGSAILAGSDLSVVDSYLHSRTYPLYTNGNSARLTLRHNTVSGSITLSDDSGAVTDVDIDGNRLQAGSVAIWAPRGAGSRDLRVTSNEFVRGSTPASGWNPQSPGNTWTGNVWSDTREPVTP